MWSFNCFSALMRRMVVNFGFVEAINKKFSVSLKKQLQSDLGFPGGLSLSTSLPFQPSPNSDSNKLSRESKSA